MGMNLRIAGTVNHSFVDGPGIRYSIFVQGCNHNCKGCHNPDTHDPSGGKIIDTDDLISIIKKDRFLDGITLTGGDPLEQPIPCTEIARAAHDIGLSVWCYTGYTWEDIINRNSQDEIHLLENVDILVDGPFVLSEQSDDYPYRGSRNQRLIIVKESLRLGKVVELNCEV